MHARVIKLALSVLSCWYLISVFRFRIGPLVLLEIKMLNFIKILNKGGNAYAEADTKNVTGIALYIYIYILH